MTTDVHLARNSIATVSKDAQPMSLNPSRITTAAILLFMLLFAVITPSVGINAEEFDWTEQKWDLPSPESYTRLAGQRTGNPPSTDRGRLT